MRIKCLYIIAVLACLANELKAQCLEPPAFFTTNISWLNDGTPAQAGSSFEACMDGEVTRISIRFYTDNPGGDGILIFRDVAMAGALGTVGATNEYSQAISVNAGAGVQSFVLNTPYWVSNGMTYAWLIEGPQFAFEIDATTTNPYPNNGIIDNDNFKQPIEFDLAFQVEINSKPAIPTLSQWGLIILGLCFSVIGVMKVRQRTGAVC